jgi:Arc/MetJ-type ribon-helix-helix transcriptional regulator
MTLKIKPEHEQIIRQQIASGHFKSVDEVLAVALASLPFKTRSSSTAVARMIEFSGNHSVKLPPGESIDGLIDEGHRF